MTTPDTAEDSGRPRRRDQQQRAEQEAASADQPVPVEHAWTRSVDEVLDELDSSKDGLSSDEIERRLERFGRNELRRFERRGLWSIFVDQLKSMVIVLLGAAALASLLFGDYVEAAAIGGVIVINTLIGFFTEFKAVRSMEALREFEEIETEVVREGRRERVSAREIVPGDVIALDEGDMIPADLRLIEVSDLELDESALTGESVPVAKQLEPVDEDTPLAERASMAYKGTAVTRGSGLGVVAASGMDTEIGEIAGMVAAAGAEATPLEERLDKLAGRLVWFVLAVSAVVAGAGFIAGRDSFLMMQTAIALAVAAIPEGLAIVATLALARGMWRMVDRNALVRRLSSVETLGSTNVICTDKTGTLTENRMTVSRFELAERSVDIEQDDDEVRFVADDQPIDLEEDALVAQMLRVAVLANSAELAGEHRDEPTGDPMEIALLKLGHRVDMSRTEIVERHPEQRVEPFSSETKMVASFHRVDDEVHVAVKGAPEAVIDASRTYLTEEGEQQLDDDARQRWNERSEEAAEEGLRVLAVATREVSDADADPYEDLQLLGLVGFVDPPRDGVPSAVERCRHAGIHVVMVTGDHPKTAGHIAHQVRLVDRDDHPVRTGDSLEDPEGLSDQEREELLETSIFARVSPRQKLNLVDLHQDKGHIVAMTGDGVNDAPALKSADIGIAMGERGTEVAREAADMVLLDDAFSTLVAAVEQGRIIFNNIRKFVLYLLSGNVGEILAVGFAAILGFPLPLLPLQILYLNLINDVFPALALGVGPGGEEVMERAPRDPDEPFLRAMHWGVIGGYGVVIAATISGAFAVAYVGFDKPYEQAVTVSFLTLSLSRLWHVFNMRDDGTGLIDNDVTRNPWVWGAIAVSLGLLAIAIWVEPLANILSVTPPDATGWAIIGVASVVPLILGQIYLVIRGRFEEESERVRE